MSTSTQAPNNQQASTTVCRYAGGTCKGTVVSAMRIVHVYVTGEAHLSGAEPLCAEHTEVYADVYADNPLLKDGTSARVVMTPWVGTSETSEVK